VAIRPDGKVVAAGNQMGVQFWDATTGKPFGPLLRHPARVNSLAFSADGKFVITGCRDGKARVFCAAPEVPDDLDRVADWIDVVTGTTLEPHQSEIRVLENPVWLATRERLEQRGGPPQPASDPLPSPKGRLNGLAWTLSQVRLDGVWEEFWSAYESAQVAPHHDSVEVYRAPLAIAERLMAKYPGDPDYRGWVISGTNTLAWRSATDADAKLQDPAQAVELARTLVRVAPNDAACWNTLGAAFYRDGDWSMAIEALRKSNELDAKACLGFNAYFLAMAHWRRGEAAPAKIWFDIARRWHQRTAPADQELGRFRAKAAALFGTGPEADREAESAPADDAAVARLILQADPAATWARAWLGRSTTGVNQANQPRPEAPVPSAPETLVRP
jgi:tetratricopeptide (TPR) repeat protein